MSTLISTVIDECALKIGDPNKQRITLSQWVTIYNMSNREMCSMANILKFQDEFDLVANQKTYDYPEGMVQCTDIHVSETPDDETTFKFLNEIFEDEYRERVDSLFPSATLPTEYYATPSWFSLVPMASAGIVDGGCITYFGLPDEISESAVSGGEVLQVPDFTRDYLRRRMLIHAMEARNRLTEAKAALEIWMAEMEGLQDKLEDRSLDRRSSLAPRKNRYAGMR